MADQIRLTAPKAMADPTMRRVKKMAIHCSLVMFESYPHHC
jgi:hypothetical protein